MHVEIVNFIALIRLDALVLVSLVVVIRHFRRVFFSPNDRTGRMRTRIGDASKHEIHAMVEFAIVVSLGLLIESDSDSDSRIATSKDYRALSILGL